MPIRPKLIVALLVPGLLAAGTLYRMDAYGIRRGCFAGPLDQAGFEAASDLKNRAYDAMASRNYAAANDMLDMALSRLGDDYALGRHRDQTVETVAAAKAAAAASQMQIAARMKYDVMDQRLGLFQKKMRLSGLCHDMARRWHLI